MSWTIIIALILAGLLFLVLEILVIPGTGVVGIAGFALVVFGIFESYHAFGTTAGHYTLITTILATVGALYFSLKSKTWKRLALNKNIEGKMNVVDEESIHPGDRGRTISRLAPMGKAMINGAIVEVQSLTGFVDEEKEVTVVKVSSHKILVKPS
ncbi:MAG TPA: NfeD family protein [Bacteroidales bacterium]|nr:NfeD family protein [Bacteroidales bacterium]